MSEEDSSGKAPYERHPVAVASVILLMFFGSIYGVGVYFNYAPNIVPILLNPVVGITIGVVFLLVVGIGGFLWIRGSDAFGGGEIADQLTKREADRVATRWHRNRGFLERRSPLDGVDYVQSGSGEESDHARIYEKVIEPKTDSNRKCILINLEQSVSVDIEDRSSLDRAIMSINDAVFFSEDAVRDFHEAREEYKEKLAGSSPGETVIEEKPDGSVIRRNVQERTIQSADKNQDSQNIEAQG
jgi:hypothetical protein